jgi:hypothetical protein
MYAKSGQQTTTGETVAFLPHPLVGWCRTRRKALDWSHLPYSRPSFERWPSIWLESPSCKLCRITHVIMKNTKQCILQARYTASSEMITVTCRIVSFLRGIEFKTFITWLGSVIQSEQIFVFIVFDDPCPIFKIFYHDICFCVVLDFVKYLTILQSPT